MKDIKIPPGPVIVNLKTETVTPIPEDKPSSPPRPRNPVIVNLKTGTVTPIPEGKAAYSHPDDYARAYMRQRIDQYIAKEQADAALRQSVIETQGLEQSHPAHAPGTDVTAKEHTDD